MNRRMVRSRVDADGVLRIAVPVGIAEDNREMQVTIGPLPQRGDERTEYLAWLEKSVGRWMGDFERLPQGHFEEREHLVSP